MHSCTLDPELTGVTDTQFTGGSSPTPLTDTQFTGGSSPTPLTDTQFTGGSSPTPLTDIVKADTITIVRNNPRKMTNVFITYMYMCTHLHRRQSLVTN